VKPAKLSGTKVYLREEINELETNSKNKNIGDLYRDVNEFKQGHQPRTKLVKDENDDLLADSHSILNRRKSYFCELLNIHGINDVRQTEVHVAEPIVTESSFFKAELIQAGGNTLCSEIHKLIISISNKEELPQQW